jgi:uncharacterized protein with PQ loop repeat
MDTTVLIGYIAAFTSSTMALPQVFRTFKMRNEATHLEGLSLGTYMIWFVNGVLWAYYGFAVGAIPAAIPSLVNIPLTAAVLFLILRARHRASGESLAQRVLEPVERPAPTRVEPRCYCRGKQEGYECEDHPAPKTTLIHPKIA